MKLSMLLRSAALALAVMFAAGASLAYAQDEVVVNAPFAFRAGSTVYQPGKYTLKPNPDESSFQIVPPTGSATFAPVVTRLEKNEPAATDAKVVFDKIGGVYYLSEVWIPGFDGYLVRATKEKHSHVSVKSSKRG